MVYKPTYNWGAPPCTVDTPMSNNDTPMGLHLLLGLATASSPRPGTRPPKPNSPSNRGSAEQQSPHLGRWVSAKNLIAIYRLYSGYIGYIYIGFANINNQIYIYTHMYTCLYMYLDR